MSRTHRLAVVLALNLALVASLIAVGMTANSVAVLAEGGDYLLDAAGVAATGAIILATGGWYWLDPAVALAIAVVVAYQAVALIRKVAGRLRPSADRTHT